MNTYARQLLVTMYGKDIGPNLADQGVLVLADKHPWQAELAFVAATPHTVTAAPAVDAVIASACVDHCEADPKRLAATVLADLVHGATIARHLEVPLLSLVGTGQEIRLVPGGDVLASSWHVVAGLVTETFGDLRLPEGSRLVMTDDEAVWQLLTTTAEGDRGNVSDTSLDGLYHLGDDSAFPRGTPFGYFYDYYRYNIACYRRPVIEALLDRPSRGVLVVENVQQVKAVTAARRLADGWPVEHLVTLPAPSKSGTERATRASGGDRITLDELLDQTDDLLTQAHPDSRAYWRAVLTHHTQLTSKGIPA